MNVRTLGAIALFSFMPAVATGGLKEKKSESAGSEIVPTRRELVPQNPTPLNLKPAELVEEMNRLRLELKEANYRNRFLTAYEKIRPSYVGIDYTPNEGGGSASGNVVEVAGIGKVILTCAHNVVHDSNAARSHYGRQAAFNRAVNNDIKIVFYNGKETTGRVLVINGKPAINPEMDIALVIPKDGFPEGVVAQRVAKKQPAVGTEIIMIGNQGGDIDGGSISFRTGKIKEIEDVTYGLQGLTSKVDKTWYSNNSVGGDSGSGATVLDTLEIIAVNGTNSDGDSKDGAGPGVKAIRSFMDNFGLQLTDGNENLTSNLKSDGRFNYFNTSR